MIGMVERNMVGEKEIKANRMVKIEVLRLVGRKKIGGKNEWYGNYWITCNWNERYKRERFIRIERYENGIYKMNGIYSI